MLDLGGYAVIAGATVGAMLSIMLSMKIASVRGRITSTQLVLAGIATSALFSAITNLIIYGGGASDKTKTAFFGAPFFLYLIRKGSMAKG